MPKYFMCVLLDDIFNLISHCLIPGFLISFTALAVCNVISISYYYILYYSHTEQISLMSSTE